ncbi:MAG: hypothetical protein SGILL_009755, partial [Bacillariaceae sp.]
MRTIAYFHLFASLLFSSIAALTSSPTSPKKVVIVGGGWAGYSAADTLSTIQLPDTTTAHSPAFEIELLDASPRGPGGLAGGWKTPKTQRPVEAGLHGFWREYKNTFAAIERIGLNLDDVLTQYTPSMLVSSSGKVALAPVMGNDNKDAGDLKISSLLGTNPLDSEALLSRIAELLPPPLDLALLSDFEGDNPLTNIDRVSGIGLLGAWADFEQEDPVSWERYDKISADNLFLSIAGVTPTLYNELVSPLLHVLPMTPGYDCSAAAALSCFHVFALQSRGAFDVRWCRGTITEKIFNPWTQLLQEERGNVSFRGGAKVTEIIETASSSSSSSKSTSKYQVTLNDGDETIDCDAIVFAIGGTSLKNLSPSCPPLANLPIAEKWQRFRGVTCVAVRLFFDSPEMISSIAEATKDSPVVVCGAGVGGIKELTETGFCIYDVERIQDGDDVKATLEVDFFRADPLAALSDEEVVEITLQAVSAALGISPIQGDSVIADASVVRARNAVSHFCVDSASWSPDVKLNDGLYICGDWIDRTGHASWSTEKSVVTGIQAATALVEEFGLEAPSSKVIPAASDTPQLQALRQLSRTIRGILPPGLEDAVKPQAPWVLARQLGLF